MGWQQKNFTKQSAMMAYGDGDADRNEDRDESGLSDQTTS